MLLLLGAYTPPSTPSITIQAPTGITQNEAVIHALIGAGALTLTEYGVEYSTTPYAGTIVRTVTPWTGGAFTQQIVGLTSNSTYYYRIYATNSLGTTTTSWAALNTLAITYNIEINGIDRTADILIGSVTIEDAINDQINTCSLSIIDRSLNGFPDIEDEIIITLNDGTAIFGGYIVSANLQKKGNGAVQMDLTCSDYTRLLDRNLVHRSYEGYTDAEIINDFVTRYCAGQGITTTNVISGVTIDQISFNYIQISQALKQICDLTGRNWYIDYDKDIHYFPLTTNVTPFNITSASANYTNLVIKKDNSQLKNRVYVRGGTKLSDETSYSTKGDSSKRKFVLPDKPHDVTVKVNGSTKSVGIKNINTSGYDYYLNFQEKYVEQDSGATILASTDVLQVLYKYDIPILVAVEDTPSIAQYGQKEFAIFDKTISTTQAARDRATAELTDYANSIIEGSFITYEDGFKSGQYINITLTEYDVSADYIVQKVVARSMGAGRFEYEISLASSKTMGIIRFLIELLEANKNLIELDDSEVVDELLAITDALLSDSLTDSLIIDSAGPAATWCSDSLQVTPKTRARWDLFQWV